MVGTNDLAIVASTRLNESNVDAPGLFWQYRAVRTEHCFQWLDRPRLLAGRNDVVPAPVYFLFDNRDYPVLGTWGPKLICYRVSRIARQRWGPGSVVVGQIIGKDLRTAITHELRGFD